MSRWFWLGVLIGTAGGLLTAVTQLHVLG